MTTNYPNSLDAFTLKTDGIDDVMAADINNLQDAILAVETALYSGDGWMEFSPTLTYNSFSGIIGIFKIVGDVTSIFRRKRPIKLVQSGNTKYFYVVSSSYAAPDTTVTITGGSDYTLANEAISGVKVGISDNPAGFPWSGGHIALKTPLGSTSWDGDTFSTTAKTLIDLSSVFGAPDNITEAQVRFLAWDSGSGASTDCWIGASPNNIANNISLACWLAGNPNSIRTDVSSFVACDSNGDIYYQIKATGAGTLTAYMFILSFTL